MPRASVVSSRETPLHGRSTTLMIAPADSRDGRGGCRTEAAVMRMTAPRDAAPATGDDAPVGATKVAVAQRVAYRVDGAVDVAQPVSCRHGVNRSSESTTCCPHKAKFHYASWFGAGSEHVRS